MTQPPPPGQPASPSPGVPPAGPPAAYPYPPPAPPPAPPGGRPRKGMPGWVIALIIGGVLLCCVGPVVACGIGLVATDFGRDLVPEPVAEVTVTSCDVHPDEYSPYAEVSYELTNVGDGQGSFRTEVTVYDEHGGWVGSASDWVWDVSPEDTHSSQVTVYLDSDDGSYCDVQVENTWRW